MGIGEFQVMAMGAMVMGRQGVDLGDVGHGRGKGRTDGATATDDIVFGLIRGELNQAMGDVISNGIAVADNPIEFPLETVPHPSDVGLDLGIVIEGIVVTFMEMGFAKLADLQIRMRQVFIRGKDFIRNRGDIVIDERGDIARIGDDDLLCLVFLKPRPKRI